MPIQIKKIEEEERRTRKLERPLGDKIYEFLCLEPENAFELEEIMIGLGDRSGLMERSQTPGQFLVSAVLELAVAYTGKDERTKERYQKALRAEIGKGRVRVMEHEGTTYYAMGEGAAQG